MDEEELSRSLSELQASMRQSFQQIAKTELSNMLQVEIFPELLSGRRTIAELVQTIYALETADTGYSTQYSRVRNEIRQMESRGLVVRRPFGRDRPYKLTQLAVVKMAMATSDTAPTVKVLPRRDMAVYATALGLGIVTMGMALAGVETPALFLALSFAFAFTSGIAFCQFLHALKRVMG